MGIIRFKYQIHHGETINSYTACIEAHNWSAHLYSFLEIEILQIT